MSRIKRVAGAAMISGALALSAAPAASAAETEAQHCFPFVDHPVICLVVCTAQNAGIKQCDVAITCNYELLPTVCAVVEEVWDAIP